MTKRTKKRQIKLAYEILGLIGISALVSTALFLILSWAASAVAETYCFENDVVMTEFDWIEVDRWISTLSGTISALGFSLLFLALLSDRITYIRTITKGIDNLRLGRYDCILPLEGRNELTQLADAVNYMSDTQRRLREKEQAIALEKEQFIRALSHDIRTPLTSILAYSQYLAGENGLTPEEEKEYLKMIEKKAEQIRDLTGLMLDADKRTPEYFNDAHLLMEQLAAEFEEELEDRFEVLIDMSHCPSFAGAFDVQELRRIFDNLSSNVQKYADCEKPVYLNIYTNGRELCIQQSNSIPSFFEKKDSYKLGISIIRRIVSNYRGNVAVLQDHNVFSINITLSEF